MFSKFYFILFFISLSVQARLVLTPQKVIDLAISQGDLVKNSLYIAEKGKKQVALAKSVFDARVNFGVNYNFNQTENLSGQENIEDKTLSYSIGLSKKFSYGTYAEVKFDKISQNSVLDSFSQTLRDSSVNLNSIAINWGQDLLDNFGGKVDRMNIDIATLGLNNSSILKSEDLEKVVLQNLQYFWDAYVARETIKEAKLAQKKYDQLVKFVKSKAKVNFITPGELSQVLAEYEIQVQRVKLASVSYLQKLDSLYDSLNILNGSDCDFKIVTLIPTLPKINISQKIETRDLQIQKNKFKIAKINYDKASVEGLPSLKLVGGMKFAGVEEEQGAALTEMVQGTKPQLYIGVEFSTLINSSLVKGELYDRKIDLLIEENNLKQARKSIYSKQMDQYRTTVAQYFIAKSALKTVKLRDKVVRERETGFKQGRIDLSDLIRSYNEYFSATLSKVKAIGQYHMSLNALASLRDVLVQEKRN